MLHLTRRVGTSIKIGDDIKIKYDAQIGSRAKLLIKAPIGTKINTAEMIFNEAVVYMLPDDSVMVGETLITIIRKKMHGLEFGFDAPAHVKIFRMEIWERERIKNRNIPKNN